MRPKHESWAGPGDGDKLLAQRMLDVGGTLAIRVAVVLLTLISNHLFDSSMLRMACFDVSAENSVARVSRHDLGNRGTMSG